METEWKAYQYTPTKVGAIIACTLFAVMSVACAAQIIRAFIKLRTSIGKRQVLSLIPFFFGGIFEVVGYLGRILSLSDTEKLSPYIMQSLLLLLAPPLFAATIYMVLGRVIADLRADKHSIIRLKWLTKIFVIGDVISFFVQAAGGGLQTSSSLLVVDLGKTLLTVGLFMQIAFFGFFILVLGIFQWRIIREPTSVSLSTRYAPSSLRNWQTIIYTLFFCSTMIFIRCVVRAVEYIQGNDGYIISHEVFLYIFDGVMMFSQMVVFCIQDVGDFLSRFEERIPSEFYQEIFYLEKL